MQQIAHLLSDLGVAHQTQHAGEEEKLAGVDEA